MKRGLRIWGRYHFCFYFRGKRTRYAKSSDGSLVGFLGMPVVPSPGELTLDCRLVQDLSEISKPQTGVSTSPGYSRTSPLGPRKPSRK